MSVFNYENGVTYSNSSTTINEGIDLCLSVAPNNSEDVLYFSIENGDSIKTTKTRFYIAKPNQKVKRGLLGINKAKLKACLNDIWEIDFEIDKYITDRYGKIKENPIYNLLSLSMEIKVDNIGWFRINNEPQENYDGERWCKSFTAYGYETTLQDIDLVGIVINCGTEDSIEMYEENLDVVGIPKHNIQFFIKNENNDTTSENYWKLGLLNILEKEYLCKKGWRIGNVETGLPTLRGRSFEIDNINVYRFLTCEIPAAYKCIPIFNRNDKTIDFVKLESLGKDLNIELNLRNFINTVDILDRNDDYFNRFRVSGSDSETSIIEYINYGSDKIENLDYCIASGMLDDTTINKYKKYKEFVDENRNIYAEYTRSFLKLIEEKTNLQELLPVQEVEILYTNISDDELNMELLHFQEVLSFLEELHTIDGILNIDGTTDYSLYISVKDVIIPKIQAEIDARKDGKHAEEFEYDTNWELYGTNELEIRKISYEAQIDVLAEKGFNKPWGEDSSNTEIYHTKQYELYIEYSGYVEAINLRLEKLNKRISEIDEQIKTNTSEQNNLAKKAKLEYEDWGFTESELSDIYFLYRETDFTDSTIEVLETDEIDDIIQLAWDLYNSATEQLEIESHPQLSYSISIDNLLANTKFSKKMFNLSIGDFCHLGLDNGFHTKQRIVELNVDLVDLNSNDISMVFSDMTTVCGKADDYRFILENGSNSSKNSISRSTANYISSAASTIANTVAIQLLNKYFGSGGSIFPNGINQADLIKLTDALDGLVKGELSLEELKANLAKIDTLESDSAFIKYLDAKYLTGDVGDFKELEADVANIKNALIGIASLETGIIINLTADNAVIDEAFIKDVIATYITVADLKAGKILTDTFNIASEDGCLKIVGNTLQIADKDGNIVIQLGQDSKGNYGLVIRSADGAVLLDSEGLHEGIVPDNFIKTDMIADGSITEDKIDKTTMRDWTDIEGNKIFDVSKLYYGDDKFEVSYKTVKNDIKSAKITIDNLSKEIGLVVSEGTVKSNISTMQSNIEDATIGVDKWFVEIYPKNSLPEEFRDLIDFSIFYKEEIMPGKQFTYNDTDLPKYFGYGVDYIGYALTFVQFNKDENVVITFNRTTKGSLFLNGVRRSGEESVVDEKVILPFKQGWNTLEVIWNVSLEEENDDGFMITPLISELDSCDLMNCYYRTITGRECYINSKSASINVDLTSITSKVEDITTELDTKVDSDYVTQKISSSVIEQTKEYWQANFSNGIDYGTTTINKNGIVVQGADNSIGVIVKGTTSGMYETRITPFEFSGWYDGTKVFYLNEDETVTERLYANKGVGIGVIKIVPVVQDGLDGIDFLGAASKLE